MNKTVLILLMLACFSWNGIAQTSVPVTMAVPASSINSTTIGIIIYSNDAETVWNAFRFANFACQKGDSVSIFLLGKGVEAQTVGNKSFDVQGMMESYVSHGGKIFACGTCLKSRNVDGTELCPMSTMMDMYDIVKNSDKLLTF